MVKSLRNLVPSRLRTPNAAATRSPGPRRRVCAAGRGNRPPSGTARLPAGLGARDRSADGQIATGLLDLLPTKQHTSAEYAYLRQSVRTNNAAIVAEGAAKPTSVYSVVRVENSLQVIAHLSEGIPRYWLLDNQALEQSWTASCGSVWAWPWRPRC